MSFSQRIIPLRKDIDELDKQLFKILKRRLKVVEKIWILKKEHNIAPLDEKRWQEIVDNARAKALEEKLNPDLIEDIWNLIHKEALRIEK